MEISLVKKVIEERTQNWEKFSKEEEDKILNFCLEVLSYSESKSIKFDQSAGITFVTHLTTLYNRLFNTKEDIEIDDELYSQIDDEIMDISKEMLTIVKKHYGVDLSKSEMFLMATHLGAMKARIQENITD